MGEKGTGGGKDHIKRAIESVQKTKQDLHDLGLGDTEAAQQALEKQAQQALQDATERQREDEKLPTDAPVTPTTEDAGDA